TFLDMSEKGAIFHEMFGAQLAQFATEIALGQLWLIMTLLAAIATVMCFAIQDRRWVLIAFFVALATLIPLAQQGHAQGASGHAQAVNSLLIHIAGAAAWIGGLITVVVVSRVI